MRQASRLQAAALARLADLEARHLVETAPTRLTTLSGWVRERDLDVPAAQVALARRLPGLPATAEALADGRLSITDAGRVAAELAKVGFYLDSADGAIDGLDGDQGLAAVIGDGLRDAVCEHLGGLADDDPRLHQLRGQLDAIVSSGDTQAGRLEAAHVLAAEWVDTATLPAVLGMLGDALLPTHLEARAGQAEGRRHLHLTRHFDGVSWTIRGRLTAEAGALLSTVLAGELHREHADRNDPDLTADTDEPPHDQVTHDQAQHAEAPHDLALAATDRLDDLSSASPAPAPSACTTPSPQVCAGTSRPTWRARTTRRR